MIPVRMLGCAAQPLLSYLSGLGVVRLVAEQLAPDVSARWDGDHLVLICEELDDSVLTKFFVDDYQPTPLIAPWNGRGGFQDGRERDSEKIVLKVEHSSSQRFEPYRVAIGIARRTWEEAREHELIIDGKIPPKHKARFVELCRGRFPDEALAWLDTSAVLLDDDITFPLILGTGGNIGSWDISNNYLKNLDALGLLDERPNESERQRKNSLDRLALLRSALFGDGDTNLVRGSTGQFDPGGVGGPNSSASGDADALVNPWSFVLAMEGAMVFTSAVARRFSVESQRGARMASMPFTVSSTAAGYGSAADNERPKGELWAPLWRENLSYREIRHFISEGRSQWGRRQARSGLDFVRAAATLGVDRSVDEFVRYLVSERHGQNVLAVPIGRFKVHDRLRPEVDLLRQLDGWTGRAGSADTPPAVAAALNAIDRAQFTVASSRDDPRRLQAVLAALANAEREVSRSPKYRDDRHLRPVTRLSAREWLGALDDGSAEFRVAIGLASLSDQRSPGPSSTTETTGGSLADLLRPVSRSGYRLHWSTSGPRVPNLGRRPLFEVLKDVFGVRAVLSASKRSDKEAQEHVTGLRFAFDRGLSIDLVDVGYLLSGQLDERRLGDILAGLLLLDWKDSFGVARECLSGVPDDAIARTHVKGQPIYAVLAPFFVGRLPVAPTDTEPNPNGSIFVRPRPEWIGSIRTGVPYLAAKSAARLLRGYGWKLITDDYERANIDPSCLATALLLHIDRPARDQWQMRLLLNYQSTTVSRAPAS